VTAPRKPARENYDAVVGLDPNPDHKPQFAFALVKFTFELTPSGLVPAPPEPLLFDVFNDPELEPPLPPGSDYWFNKPATDVMVRGCAFSGSETAFRSMSVSVTVADRTKRVSVFGPRRVAWSAGGTPSFTEPELVEAVPLLYQLAYGGLDARAPIPDAMAADYDALLRAGMACDHPGLYPRNPVGRGYVALPGPVEDLELPLLEDPSDLLTPERLCAGSPQLWYRQPLPWCFEWLPGAMFPRCRYLGLDGWYPSPQGPELPEVARSYLAPNLTQALKDRPQLMDAYLQEASLGMTFAAPLAGKRVEIVGMHAQRPRIQFNFPPEPRVEMEIEGQRESVHPRLINVVILPGENRLMLTYAAKASPFSRVFIPGIHKLIPASVSVNGDRPVHYETPPTVRERLRQTAG